MQTKYKQLRQTLELGLTEYGRLFGYGKRAYTIAYEKEKGIRNISKADEQIMKYIEFLIKIKKIDKFMMFNRT